MESSTLSSRSRVDTMGISAAGCVMRTRSPGANIRRIECVVEMSGVERRPVYEPWRIESPAKRTVKNSIQRHERISREPRIPIPSAPAPAKTPETSAPVARPPAVSDHNSRRIYVRFCLIVRSQTAPAIQIVAVHRLLVELRFLVKRVAGNRQIVSSLYFDLPVTFLH